MHRLSEDPDTLLSSESTQTSRNKPLLLPDGTSIGLAGTDDSFSACDIQPS